MAASGDALQPRRALSHRTSCLMRLRPGIGIEPILVGLKRGPVDETGVVLREENGPLSDGQVSYAFPDDALLIDIAFALGLAVAISASIHRVREDMVDG